MGFFLAHGIGLWKTGTHKPMQVPTKSECITYMNTATTLERKCRHFDALQWRHNGAMAYQITSLTIVYSAVYSGADQRKHQSSASLAFVRGIHRWAVNSPHKWPVKRKRLPFHDVIMAIYIICFNELRLSIRWIRVDMLKFELNAGLYWG